MDYQNTIPFSGNVEKALEVARNVFIQHSFRIIRDSRTELEFEGTGTILSKGQDPLVGASKVYIHCSGSELSIEAEFGGIRKTIKFLMLFILGMAVFFLVIFGILFTRQGQSFEIIILLSLAPLAPWPIIIPLMTKFMKYRTRKALDALLHNMTFLGK